MVRETSLELLRSFHWEFSGLRDVDYVRQISKLWKALLTLQPVVECNYGVTVSKFGNNLLCNVLQLWAKQQRSYQSRANMNVTQILIDILSTSPEHCQAPLRSLEHSRTARLSVKHLRPGDPGQGKKSTHLGAISVEWWVPVPLVKFACMELIIVPCKWCPRKHVYILGWLYYTMLDDLRLAFCSCMLQDVYWKEIVFQGPETPAAGSNMGG